MTRSPTPLPTSGYTLLELLVVLAILSIMAGLFLDMRPWDRRAAADAQMVAATLKAARSKAMAQTGAVKVTFDAAQRSFNLAQGASCSTSSWKSLPGETVQLQKGVSAVIPPGTTWSVCFNARGLATSAASMSLKDKRPPTYTITVFLGGAVQVTS